VQWIFVGVLEFDVGEIDKQFNGFIDEPEYL
jgi:hypothetical protein